MIESAGQSESPPVLRQRSYRYIDLVMAVFITVLITSNIASSAKIVDWGISLAGIPLAFDAGTILFPVSYIFGDVLTEVYGYKRSRRVIWVGFACLVLTSVVLGIVLFGEPATAARLGFLGLLVISILGLKLTA